MDAGRAVGRDELVGANQTINDDASPPLHRRHRTGRSAASFWGGERVRRWGGAGTRNPHISVRVAF